MTTVFVEPAMRVSTWRSLWPARELARRGHQTRVFAFDADRHGEVYPEDDIVFHITAGTWMESRDDIATPFSMVQRFTGKCRRLWVSFSDDLTQLWHVQPTPEDITARLRLFIADLPIICRQAYGVIVTTPRLAEVYGRWANELHVCEAYLPGWVHEIRRPATNGRLGWMGTLDVHAWDLTLLRDRAAELPPMHLIGPGRKGADLLRSWGARDVTATGLILKQRELYEEMARCRAAVVPLITTGKIGRFNAGKAWIKPMEFLTLGVPTVATPHPEYLRLGVACTPLDEQIAGAALALWDDPTLTRWLPPSVSMETIGGDQWEKALTS